MCATAMLASCVDQKIDDSMSIDGSVPSQSLALKPQVLFNADQAIAGEIIVKFRESTIEQIESATTLMTDGIVASGVESIDKFCKTVGAYNIVSARLVCICGTRFRSTRVFRCRKLARCCRRLRSCR